MQYGKVDSSELGKIDFKLPPDGSFTQKQFTGSRNPDLKVYIGCAKWGRPDWIGKLYPAGTKERDFLQEYVRHFNSIELNATHYKIYPPESIAKWDAKAADRDFKFCPKVPQSISHYSDLGSERAREFTDGFLRGIHAFGEHLGPVFLQVSEKYGPQKQDALFSYIRDFPKDIDLCVEVRHPDWFTDKTVRKTFFSFLEEQKTGTVITDTSGKREGVHMELTTPVAFIRFVGNNGDKTDIERLDDWVERLAHWIENGIREIYFFMHQPEERYSPEMCAYLIQKVNVRCELSVDEPQLIDKGPELF